MKDGLLIISLSKRELVYFASCLLAFKIYNWPRWRLFVVVANFQTAIPKPKARPFVKQDSRAKALDYSIWIVKRCNY